MELTKITMDDTAKCFVQFYIHDLNLKVLFSWNNLIPVEDVLGSNMP